VSAVCRRPAASFLSCMCCPGMRPATARLLRLSCALLRCHTQPAQQAAGAGCRRHACLDLHVHRAGGQYRTGGARAVASTAADSAASKPVFATGRPGQHTR
jgi:hypothetical protein